MTSSEIVIMYVCPPRSFCCRDIINYPSACLPPCLPAYLPLYLCLYICPPPCLASFTVCTHASLPLSLPMLVSITVTHQLKTMLFALKDSTLIFIASFADDTRTNKPVAFSHKRLRNTQEDCPSESYIGDTV